jgi:general secretion pathway protein D
VDLVTNKRTITTNVLIEDGGVVVLGGLIEDNSVKGEQRVPYLGNIPLIGLLFKTRNATSTKNNLIMFIRPKILRDQAQAAYETDLKYNYMRDQQRNLDAGHDLVPLLPGVSRGTLNPLPPPPAQPVEHVAPGQPQPAPSAAFPVIPPPAGAAPATTAPGVTTTPAPDSNAVPATPNPATTPPPGKP